MNIISAKDPVQSVFESFIYSPRYINFGALLNVAQTTLESAQQVLI